MDEITSRHRPSGDADPAIAWGEAVAAVVEGSDFAGTVDVADLRSRLKQRPWFVFSRAHLLDALHDRLALHDTEPERAQIGRFARTTRWGALRARWWFWRQSHHTDAWQRDTAHTARWLLTRTRRDARGLRTADLAPEELARFAALVRSGTAAEYLSAQEAADAYTILAEALRERCDSWQQFADAYAVGAWARRKESDRSTERADDAATAARIAALSAPTGAWGQVPWDLPLPRPSGRFFDALAEPGGKNRHWKGPGDGWQQRINAELHTRGVPPRGFSAS